MWGYAFSRLKVTRYVFFHPRRRSHDETALRVAARQALDLYRNQRQPKAFLAPAAGVAGIHHANREIGARPASLLQPGI